MTIPSFGWVRTIALLAGAGCGLCACDSLHNGVIGFGKSDDASIKAAIQSEWHQTYPDVAMPDIAVSAGVVTLLGTVPSAQQRVDLVRDAWQPDGVKEVVNELQVPTGSNAASNKDLSLTIKLRARLTFDPDIASTNYSIETVHGTIYLMGIAHSQEELDKVIHIAQTIGGQHKVVSYVQVKDSGTRSDAG